MRILSPLVDFSIALAVIVSALAALLFLHQSSASFTPQKVSRIVTGLRILALLSLALALFNPFWKHSTPDPSAYRVVILGDVSRSMETQDLPNETSRLEWLSKWLAESSADPGFNQIVNPDTPVAVRLFSNQTQAWNGHSTLDPAPGLTTIGDALSTIHASASSHSQSMLGGVLLLSDGINLSGTSPFDASTKFAHLGIPVSVIGIGETVPKGDVSIEFVEAKQQFTEGEAGSVDIELQNSYDLARSGKISIYQNDQMVAQQEIMLEANEQTTTTITTPVSAPGIDTLRAVFEPNHQGDNPATNTSFSIAETERSEEFQFLQITSQGNWSGRLLRILSNEAPNFLMDSLIRIDEERYFLNQHSLESEKTKTTPLQRKTLPGIPSEPDFYRSYDALILDDSTLLQNTDTLAPILLEFVDNKGGGILLIHSEGTAQKELSPELSNLFPARQIEPSVIDRSMPLQFEGTSLFADSLGGTLFSDPAPEIPRLAQIGRPQNLSRAVSVSVQAQPGNLPILATHAYGAGRAAWLATDSFWQWRFEGTRGKSQYQDFWEGLLSWLAVGGRDRMTTPINTTVTSMDEEVDLSMSLLGRDYSPKMDANVTALLTGPNGESKNIHLIPSIDTPGDYHYSESFGTAGTWRVDYSALFSDGDELAKTAWFVVAATSPESTQTSFQEKTLRDIARITGGSYHSYANVDDLSALPLSNQIPHIDRRIEWTRTWPFLLAAITLLFLEWWLRRKNGLR